LSDSSFSKAGQVIAAPVPGEVTGFLGGYLFGTFFGVLFSTIGLSLGSYIATEDFTFWWAQESSRPLSSWPTKTNWTGFSGSGI
jgi:hypothetical protein